MKPVIFIQWPREEEGKDPLCCRSVLCWDEACDLHPVAPGRGGLGGTGVLAPFPSLADEETDSAAVSALLGGTGQVCAE